VDDNVALRGAILSKKGVNGPYEEFNDKEVKNIGGKLCIVDAWKYPLLYCHFSDYDPNWATNQSWRFGKKEYEFQVISAGAIWHKIDSSGNGHVENSELDGQQDRQELVDASPGSASSRC
jgi:hypothetical protein